MPSFYVLKIIKMKELQLTEAVIAADASASLQTTRKFMVIALVSCHGFSETKAEKKKRKAQLQEAHLKKMIKRVERKMAAVARDRAWTERLAELKKLEEEKKAAMA
ncbi:hypothetical protein K7X08_031383 [Anisodus acutangulus]|uniref:Uncharacterized protein n=1 Tax=Anisodus acutangulus TaxID=402998 RepID=A0A9Q1MP94_9SOLA|nr:hypothetical protein K7X08_031383 [Anisodus acutangulus]